jgi:hypothetical protein
MSNIIIYSVASPILHDSSKIILLKFNEQYYLNYSLSIPLPHGPIVLSLSTQPCQPLPLTRHSSAISVDLSPPLPSSTS